MKRRTEIKIELTRTLHIRRCHAAPCWCAVCAEQGEMDAPKAAAVLIDVNIPTKSPALCERRTKMLHSHHSSHDTRQLLPISPNEATGSMSQHTNAEGDRSTRG